MVDTLSTLTYQSANIYDRNLLYVAKPALIFWDKGQKKNVKANDGQTVRWRRYAALSANTTALSEGVTPAATAVTQAEVTATLAQYGGYGEFSDMINMTGIDQVIMDATDIFGRQAGLSTDTIVGNVMKAGTSVLYATGSSRGAQAATNIITVALIRKAVRNLDVNNTLRFNGQEENKQVGAGNYIIFIHPKSVYDLKNDTEWKTMQENVRPEFLLNGSIGIIEGCQVIQSTICPVFTGEGSGGVDVYGTMIVGEHAYGVTQITGKDASGKFKTIAKPFGSGGTSDPLDQRSTVGWKSLFVSKILNDNFMTRIEHGVTA